jgi:hypothetical protein
LTDVAVLVVRLSYSHFTTTQLSCALSVLSSTVNVSCDNPPVKCVTPFDGDLELSKTKLLKAQAL